tara:strand:+ start:314 stop:439 length:126 start_codon:yes stop_codon:yes gene_type:complete
MYLNPVENLSHLATTTKISSKVIAKNSKDKTYNEISFFNGV